jgi:hypothetical protein
VEKEQRGQPLLSVEGTERPVLDPAVDEIESDRVGLVADDRSEKGVQEVGADPPDHVATTALCVVALEQRDLDAFDGVVCLQL